jgi:hypothetical protein
MQLRIKLHLPGALPKKESGVDSTFRCVPRTAGAWSPPEARNILGIRVEAEPHEL